MRTSLTVLALCVSCTSAPTGIVITTESIDLDGEQLVRTGDALRFDYLNIPELEDVARRRPELCATIQADDALSFRLIKRVMFSCAAVGAPYIGFRTSTATRELNVVATAGVGRRLLVTASQVEERPTTSTGTGVELSVDDDVTLQRLLDVAAAQPGPVRIMPSAPAPSRNSWL